MLLLKLLELLNLLRRLLLLLWRWRRPARVKCAHGGITPRRRGGYPTDRISRIPASRAGGARVPCIRLRRRRLLLNAGVRSPGVLCKGVP